MRRFKAVLPLILFALILCFSLRARAEEYVGGDNWQVTLEPNGRMSSNFTSSDIDKIMQAMEPGDTAVFTVTILNANSQAAAWYISNEILHSLEDQSEEAAGGAYEYLLVYTDSRGAEKILYDSETVGGEGSEKIPEGEGLHGADSSLKNFFYLDDLAPGKGGKVTVKLTLDGESQGNSYQNTKAGLQLRFAAELKKANGSTIIVKTGEDGPPLWVWSVVLLGSGGLLLLLLILGRKKRGKEEADEEEN